RRASIPDATERVAEEVSAAALAR
ncbi:hypothetical protein, partial [Klebsiella grimontii]